MDYCFDTSAINRLHDDPQRQEFVMRELFIDLPEWSLFLARWAQGMYALALQERNYGARRTVGTIDLWFALYLEHCGFLVTDDRLLT
jgi:hypothetical protein